MYKMNPGWMDASLVDMVKADIGVANIVEMPLRCVDYNC